MTNIYFICWTNDETLQRKQLHAAKAEKIFRLTESFVVVSRIFDYFQPEFFPFLRVV